MTVKYWAAKLELKISAPLADQPAESMTKALLYTAGFGEIPYTVCGELMENNS